MAQKMLTMTHMAHGATHLDAPATSTVAAERNEQSLHQGGRMADGSVPKPVGSAPEIDRPLAQTQPRPNAWQRTFAALRYPNYRLWFLGQLVSLVGTWMQITAQSFLVYQLTHSTAYLGYVGFASGLPS